MKKNNRKGFFLSETMVVIAIVAVVLLSVFKLFNSVYYGLKESEKYNTTNAINALSNVQKYFETIEEINSESFLGDSSYIDLTNYTKYDSTYYTKLKNEFDVNSVYLIDLSKIFNDGTSDDFHITLRRYLKTLKNVNGIVLVMSLNNGEFAYVKLQDYLNVTLLGDKEDDYTIYIPIGGNFVDFGYTNWNGEEPEIYWENGIEPDTSKPGTYYLHYDFDGYHFRRKVIVGDYKSDISYNGDYQIYEAPYDGYYKIELWGASGGDDTYGGKGAYTSGVVKLNRGEKLYIYVGGKGASNSTGSNNGGYNGGGYSGNHDTIYSYGGGGATDVRLVAGEWNNDAGLNSRIMVAAGGAGSASSITTNAGGGGTLIGGHGTTSSSSFNTAEYLSKGATQTGSGFAYEGDVRAGSFGFAHQSNASGEGGGGGGGYYGGSTGYGTTGSGGSSFISGYAGVDAITSETDRTHTGNTMHYSNKYFIQGSMEAGVNSGYGKAIITYVGTYMKRNDKIDNVRYIKDCINGSNANEWNHWIEVQAIKDGINIAYGKTVTAANMVSTLPRLVDGSITSGYSESNTCITVDLGTTYDLDEIAVWLYYTDGRAYKNHYLYVSPDNSNWKTLINNVSGVASTPNGFRINAYD